MRATQYQASTELHILAGGGIVDPSHKTVAQFERAHGQAIARSTVCRPCNSTLSGRPRRRHSSPFSCNGCEGAGAYNGPTQTLATVCRHEWSMLHEPGPAN